MASITCRRSARRSRGAADVHTRTPVAAALCALPLSAASAQITRPDPCWRAAESQAQLTQCATRDSRESQQRLDRLMGELRGTLDSAAFRSLDQVQTAWLSYARAQCRWEGDGYRGGSMQPMIVAMCMAARMEERIALLKEHLCGQARLEPECEAARRYDVVTDTTQGRP